MGKTAAVGLALLLAGCVSTDVLRVDEQPRPPRRVEDVRVLLEEPRERFKVIAVVHADSNTADLEKMKAEVLEKAAKLGGDAVILKHTVGRPRRHWNRMTAKVLVFEPRRAEG